MIDAILKNGKTAKVLVKKDGGVEIKREAGNEIEIDEDVDEDDLEWMKKNDRVRYIYTTIRKKEVAGTLDDRKLWVHQFGHGCERRPDCIQAQAREGKVQKTKGEV